MPPDLVQLPDTVKAPEGAVKLPEERVTLPFTSRAWEPPVKVPPFMVKAPVVMALAPWVRVPFVTERVRVLPRVRASPSWKVPPTPLKVKGKSRVLPLVVRVLVPEVAPKVVMLLPEERVMPPERVRSPKRVLVELVRVPEKPVKFKLPAAVPTVTVSEPAVMLKLGALDSVAPTEKVLVPTAPA